MACCSVVSSNARLLSGSMSSEVTAALVKENTPQKLPSSFQQNVRTPLEDIAKIHELSQKMCFSLEAQRVSGVLESCISQLEMVAILPALVAQLHSLSNIDEELMNALQRHRLLAEKLDTLEGVKLGSEEEQNEEVNDERRKVIARLETDIKNSVRGVLRYFRAHPSDIFALKAELNLDVGVSECMRSSIRGMKTFHEQEKQHLLLSMKKVPSAVTEDTQQSSALEEKRAAAISQSDADISEKTCVINKKEKLLQEEEKKLTDLISQKEQDVEKQCQSYIKSSEIKQSHSQQEIDQCCVQLKKLIAENRETEKALRERNKKLKMKIENLLKVYDDDMETMQAELEELELLNEEVKEELKQLEDFSLLETEYNQIQEERCLAEETQQKDLEMKTKAAVMAQAWWRGYSVRKAQKGKSKDKKGKKAKKGKKSK